jgi:tripartite-type tricarboxylate transporter receptor subunit TctC
MVISTKPASGLMHHGLKLFAVFMLVLSGQASAAPAQNFYAGKTLRILVGYAPGGGYDAYARVLARHLGRHIPGNPAVVVVNMPGAGSLIALRYLDTTAPKDGTVVTAFDFTQIANSRLTPDLVNVDFRKFNWIGSMAEDLAVCYVWHTVGANTLAELKTRGPIHVGRTTRGSSADIEQKIMREIFKVDLRYVAGYAGSSESMLAVERGELDGGCLSWASLPETWIMRNQIRPVLRMSNDVAPDLPATVPNAIDIAPSPRDVELIRFLTAGGEIGKPLVASLAVPAERVQILRSAFAATMKDPQLLADAQRLRLPVASKSSEEALAVVNAIYAAPADIVESARRIVLE